MRNFSKLALSLLSTFVASSLFAQCPVGSPCWQASQGRGNYPAPSYGGGETWTSPGPQTPTYAPDFSSGYSHGPYEVKYPGSPTPIGSYPSSSQDMPMGSFRQDTYMGYPVYHQQDMGAPNFPHQMQGPTYYDQQPQSWSGQPPKQGTTMTPPGTTSTMPPQTDADDQTQMNRPNR